MKSFNLILFASLLMFAGCGNQVKQNTQNEENMQIMKEERTGDEIKIVAIMTVKPEGMNDIMPIFQAVVQGSQQEEGCISYNLHQDIADSTKFVMLEEWVSQEAINYHNTTEHYKAFKEASKDMIEKSDVSKLKLVY